MHVITDERCLAYHAPGHPERPARVKNTLAKLRTQDEIPIEWHAPSVATDALLRLGHTDAHIEALRAPVADFDGDTPAYPEIDQHARRSVGGAMDALALALEGQQAFSLLRPPGHHATGSRPMGFCYLGSVGLSALHASRTLGKRVAVYDFDVHHGNGTEALLLDQPGVSFSSIHQHPCYPGTGTKNVGSNCLNYPVAPQTPPSEYRAILERAMEAVVAWQPDLIAVSAGFDAYYRDPIAQETLRAEDFRWIGERLKATGVPFYSVLEGGYSDDLPELIFAYLQGVTAG